MYDYKDEAFDGPGREYVSLREANRVKHERIVGEIYAKIPRVREIDGEIERIGHGAAARILSSGVSPEKAVNEMREAMERLSAEKKELLVSNGYAANAMSEIFSCGICKDTGFADGARCACYHRKLNKIMQKQSNIRMSDSNSFERFDMSLFSDKPGAKLGVSPRENMASIYKIALLFAEGEPQSPRNLLFYGATGLGKTYTSDCIAKRYIQNGRRVFYMSAPRLFTTFEEYKFGRDTSAKNKMAIDAVTDAELLIIDDLGTEFRTAYTDSILFDILNTRIIERKKMIISTNLSVKELKHAYSERICSRILGNFTEVLFFGDDIRLRTN